MSETVESSEGAPIPERVLSAVGRAAKYNLLALINYAFAASGIEPDDLAIRLGWSRRRVMRVLKGQTRLTLNTAAELCWAIDGSSIHFAVEPRVRD